MKLGITTKNEIKKTIPITYCSGQFLNETGEFEVFTGNFYGVTDTRKATKYYRNLTGNDSITINNCETEYRVYRVPIAEIIENYNYEIV